MTKHADISKRGMTGPDELAPNSTKITIPSSPVQNLDEKLITEGQVKVDTASASGITSDQVLTGSPAAEYGATGRFALDGMIKASERIAKEKYRESHPEES